MSILGLGNNKAHDKLLTDMYSITESLTDHSYSYIVLLMISSENYAYDFTSGLTMMASHQTFSDQIKHTSGQINFGLTNLLCIINGNFMEFAKENA